MAVAQVDEGDPSMQEGDLVPGRTGRTRREIISMRTNC